MMNEISDLSDIEMSEERDAKDTDLNIKINNSQNGKYTRSIPEHRFDKKLICIKYPGNVVNIDRAIETLGGISSISMIVDLPNRRLELRFRPNDGYSKPTCGDRHSTNGFLLRVRIKKNKILQVESTTLDFIKSKSMNIINLNNTFWCTSFSRENLDTSSSSKNKYNYKDNISNLVNQEQNCNISSMHYNSEKTIQKKYAADDINNLHDICIDKNSSKRKKHVSSIIDNNKYENLSQETDYKVPHLKILGRIDTEFKFTNLCDFQYIPITQSRSNPKKLECIYNLIYPTGIPLYSWLKNDVPYFLPPAVFSRMDTVQQYIPKTEIDSSPENVGKIKKCHAGFPNYIYFSTSEVPTVPPKGIETAMKVKLLQNTHLEQVRQLFKERPIWSKNAIMYKTQFTSEQLKILLPSVAYYFMTGPWRIMWIKLGYDPRQDINARKYQTLDYRLKAMHGLGSTVRCKRNYSNYTLPYKSAPVSKQKPAILTATSSQKQNLKKERHLHENVYIYREGMVPPSRQMFYQYCDVLVGEIQEMLAKLPDPLPGIRCHEKRGWLPTGFDVQCREILNKQVRAVLRKRMNIPEDHPTSLPRKRKHGIKLKYNKMINKRTKQSTKNSTEI